MAPPDNEPTTSTYTAEMDQRTISRITLCMNTDNLIILIPDKPQNIDGLQDRIAIRDSLITIITEKIASSLVPPAPKDKIIVWDTRLEDPPIDKINAAIENGQDPLLIITDLENASPEDITKLKELRRDHRIKNGRIMVIETSRRNSLYRNNKAIEFVAGDYGSRNFTYQVKHEPLEEPSPITSEKLMEHWEADIGIEDGADNIAESLGLYPTKELGYGFFRFETKYGLKGVFILGDGHYPSMFVFEDPLNKRQNIEDNKRYYVLINTKPPLWLNARKKGIRSLKDFMKNISPSSRKAFMSLKELPPDNKEALENYLNAETEFAGKLRWQKFQEALTNLNAGDTSLAESQIGSYLFPLDPNFTELIRNQIEDLTGRLGEEPLKPTGTKPFIFKTQEGDNGIFIPGIHQDPPGVLIDTKTGLFYLELGYTPRLFTCSTFGMRLFQVFNEFNHNELKEDFIPMPIGPHMNRQAKEKSLYLPPNSLLIKLKDFTITQRKRTLEKIIEALRLGLQRGDI